MARLWQFAGISRNKFVESNYFRIQLNTLKNHVDMCGADPSKWSTNRDRLTPNRNKVSFISEVYFWDMNSIIRKSLGLLAPRGCVDLLLKFGLFCTLIALWHASVRLYWFADTQTPLSEMLLEAVIAGAPFVLLFLSGSLHQVKAVRALTDRAYHDPLAQTLNRETFMNRLGRALPAANSGALILLDADHFKNINDRFGHAVGDRCIEAIGHRLQWNLREGDLAGRIGGEEFAVFLPNVSEIQARAIAERIGTPVSFSDKAAHLHLTVSLSAGLTFVNSKRSVAWHLKEADDALYLAKSSGRARLCIYGSDEEILLNKSGFTSAEDASKSRQDGRTNSNIRSISG